MRSFVALWGLRLWEMSDEIFRSINILRRLKSDQKPVPVIVKEGNEARFDIKIEMWLRVKTKCTDHPSSSRLSGILLLSLPGRLGH